MARKRNPAKDSPLNRLTEKDQKALLSLVGGASQQQAARTAGISPSTIKDRLHGEGEKAQQFRAAFRGLMDKAGLDSLALLEPLKDGLTAVKQLWNPKTGTWTEIPDHQTRMKAAELGLQLLGAFPREGQQVVSVVFNTNVFETDEMESRTILDEPPRRGA